MPGSQPAYVVARWMDGWMDGKVNQ